METWKSDLQYAFNIQGQSDDWFKILDGLWMGQKMRWITKIGQEHSVETLEWNPDNDMTKPTQAELKARLDEILLEESWYTLRGRRNTLLKESDWCIGNDSPLNVEDKTAWVSYRQELRDVPNQSDPNNIIWPTKPTE